MVPDADILKVKIELLTMGIDFDIDFLQASFLNYKENNYGYNNPNKSNDLFILRIIPTELIISNKTIVSCRYNSDSKYRVEKNNNSLFLCKNGEPLYDVQFSKRPLFWNKKTGRGVPMKRIGSVYGNTTLTFFLMNYCQFFNNGDECRFCSLDTTYKEIRSVELIKNTKDITDVIIAAKPERYKFTNFIGGSLYDTDKEINIYIKTIKQICEMAEIGTINGYVVSQPPKNINLLKDLRSAGINGVKFNLEVTNDNIFKDLCPGKSIYGYRNIENMLYEAVCVFGKNHVYTNFILGLSPIDEIIKKVEYLAVRNVGVVPHIFHGDYGAHISTITMDTEEIYQTYVELDKINKKYGIVPWLDKQSSRGCLSWDLYDKV